MTILASLTAILGEILDVHPDGISPRDYVLRDLKAESIDLLEIGVAIQHRMGVAVDDDRLFLKNLRVLLLNAAHENTPAQTALRVAYPHLERERIEEILADIDTGPVLQVRDLEAYVRAAQAEDIST